MMLKYVERCCVLSRYIQGPVDSSQIQADPNYYNHVRVTNVKVRYQA